MIQVLALVAGAIFLGALVDLGIAWIAYQYERKRM